jgi:hypothetical protein
MEKRQDLTMEWHTEKELERWIESAKKACASTLESVASVNDG